MDYSHRMKTTTSEQRKRVQRRESSLNTLMKVKKISQKMAAKTISSRTMITFLINLMMRSSSTV